MSDRRRQRYEKGSNHRRLGEDSRRSYEDTLIRNLKTTHVSEISRPSDRSTSNEVIYLKNTSVDVPTWADKNDFPFLTNGLP